MGGFERRARQIGCLGALLISALSHAGAQGVGGSIAGQVTDPTHAAVPNSTLRLTNKGTGAERITQSDGEGNYNFPIVAPGVYTIRAEAQGFRSLDVTSLEVQVAQQVNQNFELAVGTSATTLEVTAATPMLEQRNAEVGQVIS